MGTAWAPTQNPPRPKQFFCAALRRYQGFSTRRSAFALALRASIVTGLDTMIFPRTTDPGGSSLPFAFGAWLDQFRAERGVDCIGCIVWPIQRERGRLYVHLLTNRGENIFFVKFALGEGNATSLRSEAEAVINVTAKAPAWFKVPEFRGSGYYSDAFYTVYEPLPDGFRYSIPTDDGIGEFTAALGACKEIGASELPRLRWWGRTTAAASASKNPSFVTEFDAAASNNANVRSVHGDLGVNNLVRVAG